MTKILNIDNIHKSFNKHEVLKGVSFDVNKGEVVCLIGSSGSGKSTLLRCINRLETFDEGTILYNNKNIITGIDDINKYRSKVGMVFQSFNLFNNMSVLKNCTIAQQKVLKLSKSEAYKRSLYFLEKVGLKDFVSSSSSLLSGGQKQRVAIARSLCMNPEILLFDEPTSALDPEMVEDVLRVIKDLAKEGLTMIIVTHEMEFARDIANKIVFMDQGKVEEMGPAKDFFKNPKSKRSKTFLKRFLKSDV